MIVDFHCDTLSALEREGRHLGQRSKRGHLDLPRMVDGGIGVQFFAVYVERTRVLQGEAPARATHLIDLFYRELAGLEGKLEAAGDFREVEAILGRGGRVACLSLEGGEALGGDLETLRSIRRRGVSCMSLTWNHRNDLACGCLDGATEGLTHLGKAVVKELATLGMMADVAHLNEAGFWEVLELYPGPIIASHACARALRDHPRNLGDPQIQALAAKGGVMGLTFVQDFLAPEKASRRHLLRHLDHVAELVGVEAIGLGSDFDGIKDTPGGLETAAALHDLPEDLLRRGYKDGQVEAILGGNWLRVMEKTMLPIGG